MAREVQTRVVHCVICGAKVDIAALDSPHPEAPTLFQPLHPDNAAPWFGFVDGGTIVVTCGEPCAQRLLME